MSLSLPRTTKALILKKSSVEPPYDDVVLIERPIPEVLEPGEVVVKMAAAAFNHREVWIRKRMYPGVVFGSVLGADGAGTIVASGMKDDPLVNTRVFLTPSRGWEKDPDAPETTFGILGGGANPPIGTFSEYIVVERDQVIPTPKHLNDVQAAAWPLGGVTAWRATMVNGQVREGQNVLITGIGGGVALIAMQLCIAKGASVYVTSGSQDKIDKAIAMGAKGGVSYKDPDWPAELATLLKTTSKSRPQLDVVIDSGGDEILNKVTKVLKQGGRVVCYGMTAGRMVKFTMREVMKNQSLLGSTMGSRQDLIDATDFLAKHHIVPPVSHVLNGLGTSEEGFELLKRGEQFGKIVIKIHENHNDQSML